MKHFFFRTLCMMLTLALLTCALPAFAAAATLTESEGNGSYQDANPIGLNDTIKGTLSASYDYDYFKFRPDTNGYITIKLGHDTASDAWKFWRVTVYRYTTTYDEIYRKDIYASKNESMSKIGVAGGSLYYIYIAGESVEGMEYRLSVNFTETPYWEHEGNGGYPEANPITFGQTYGGSLHASYDYDYFKFKPEKNGYITINLGHNTINDAWKFWRVTVYRYTTSYNEIYRKDIYVSKNESMEKIGVTGGSVYYVHIAGEGVEDIEYRLTVSFSTADTRLGDLNRDGKITAADARLALRGAVGLEQITGDFLTIGDVNADKKITAADARKILRAAVGLETLS